MDPEQAPLLSAQSGPLKYSDNTRGCHGRREPSISITESDSEVDYRSCNTSTRYLGYCCAILAGLCFTSSNVMIKFIPGVNSWELLLIRCLTQLATMIPIMVVGRHAVLGTPDFATRWRVVTQGFLGGFLLLALFEAVARMPLGDSTAIFFSSPVFTMVLSSIVLKEPCGVWRVLVAITLLTGVIILTRPPSLFPALPNNDMHQSNFHIKDHGIADGDDDVYDVLGVVSALAVPLLSAWIVIIIRQAKHVHYSVLLFWFGVGALIVSIIGLFALDNDIMFHDWQLRQWILSFMIAVSSILGIIMMTKAVFLLMPSKVMVVRSFEVVVAYILQVTLFEVPTHWSDVVGTICIISAVIAMGVEDYLMEKLNWRFL